MLTLTVTKGLPASGKTRWALVQQAKDPSLVLVCKDELRALMHGGVWSKENEREVVEIEEHIVRVALRDRRSVIVHNTHMAGGHIERLRHLAAGSAVNFAIKDFTDVSVEECIRRDALRVGPAHVGEDVIRRMAGVGTKRDVRRETFTLAGRAPSRVWFTSDMHFGHVKILDYTSRPWRTLDEMNEGLVSRWNAVVGESDIVFVLGDVSMGQRDNTLGFVSRLNGVKHLVAGNHDYCWSGARSPDKWRQKYLDAGFATIHDEIDLETPWGNYMLCHFPYSGDHTDGEQRYPEWRPDDDGRWLLHGHVHEEWRRRGKQINVGVDVWSYAPVNFQEILVEIDNADMVLA